MFTADNSLGQASPSDVRNGVSYASGALTGSCAVPAASSVAFGVPVDNTTGTAVLTPAAVWGHSSRTLTSASGPTAVEIRAEMDANSTKLANLDATISSRLAPSGTLATVTTLTNAPASVTPADIWSHATRTITGGTVDTLTNAPSVPSASTIASQVRTELSTELGRLDATVSSRLASASYTAPANSDITAIKAKTDALPSDPADQSLLEAAIAGVTAPSASTVATAVRSELAAELAKVSALNTDRLAQCSTVATTGSQLAAALS
jgi:hypothetical protein